MSQKIIFIYIFILTLPIYSRSQILHEQYLNYIKQAYDQNAEIVTQKVEQWRKKVDPNSIWGYNPPAIPVLFAGVAAFLYEETGRAEYAVEAARWLAKQQEYKKAYPDDYNKVRAEYKTGLPAITNFFHLPIFARAYLRIKDCHQIDNVQKNLITQSLVEGADFVFNFPEWGPMNRAMLCAEGLLLSALALPEHPQASKWRQMAEILASDSWGHWEIEDAEIYQPVWLCSLIRYAEALKDDSIYDLTTTRYYFDYFLHLLSPSGMVPDFGDARWNSNWQQYIACFERGASIYQNPQLKWAAQRIYNKSVYDNRSLSAALIFTDAYRWANDAIQPQQPVIKSEEVLEDLIGKKIVFRNGWKDKATYLLVNYCDEGNYGLILRNYLRQTIPAEEEKMHHGHADENSICLLMSGGSVLLHDAGYRDYIPSGPYGAYCADYFHNRIVVRKNKRWLKQDLFEFLRNSGSYRKVKTEKIDFFNFREVDVSPRVVALFWVPVILSL